MTTWTCNTTKTMIITTNHKLNDDTPDHRHEPCNTTNHDTKATQLADWEEPLQLAGPSTTENWDDDFETDSVNHSQSNPGQATSHRNTRSRPESWDHEFEFGAHQGCSDRSPTKRPRHDPYLETVQGSDLDYDDDEFAFAEHDGGKGIQLLRTGQKHWQAHPNGMLKPPLLTPRIGSIKNKLGLRRKQPNSLVSFPNTRDKQNCINIDTEVTDIDVDININAEISPPHDADMGLGPGPGPHDLMREGHRTGSRNEGSKYAEDKNKPLEEGTRSFMRSVRRISMLGRHKLKPRPLPELVGDPLQDGRVEGRGSVEVWDDMDIDPQSQSHPTPIEVKLQPPSPPRTRAPPNGNTPSPAPGLPPSLPPIVIPATITPTTTPAPTPTTPIPIPTLIQTRRVPSTHCASLGRSVSGGGLSPSIDVGQSGDSSEAGGAGRVKAKAPRRNSLGDLKIPARISRAQVGLRRDLGMVREFAASVGLLKDLQSTYHSLLTEVQATLVPAQPTLSHAISNPRISNLYKPISRNRSNTCPAPNLNENPSPRTNHQYAVYKGPADRNPMQRHLHKNPAYNISENKNPSSRYYRTNTSNAHLASALSALTAKYAVSWECAEVLIEIGGAGAGAAPSSGADSAVGSGIVLGGGLKGGGGGGVKENMVRWVGMGMRKKNRERAITLAGCGAECEASLRVRNPGVGTITGTDMWRVSAARHGHGHDLTQRQIFLLREMLSCPRDSGSSLSSLGGENTGYQGGEGDGLGVSRVVFGEVGNGERKSKGKGGLRDVFRTLKKSYSENAASSCDSLTVATAQGLLDVGDSEVRHAEGKGDSLSRWYGYSRGLSLLTLPATKVAVPQRPSLATIFRVGGKGRVAGVGELERNSVSSRGSIEEEDWDRDHDQIDAASHCSRELIPTDGDPSATIRGIRGRSPYLQGAYLLAGYLTRNSTVSKQHEVASSSLDVDVDQQQRQPHSVRSRTISILTLRGDGGNPAKTASSMRAIPPRSAVLNPNPDHPKQLAMTPENIKPLLESARELRARLDECVGELRSLLALSLATRV